MSGKELAAVNEMTGNYQSGEKRKKCGWEFDPFTGKSNPVTVNAENDGIFFQKVLTPVMSRIYFIEEEKEHVVDRCTYELNHGEESMVYRFHVPAIKERGKQILRIGKWEGTLLKVRINGEVLYM